MQITAEGRLDFEQRLPIHPIVFISCGQHSENEVRLGQKLLEAVKRTEPLDGYFAEHESSLSGAASHIFNALDECSGLVVVMHRREQIQMPDSERMARASTWIEQEIAIAAFLTERLGRTIEIAAYVQNGIKLEGMREQLILNPEPFETDEEVLTHFTTLLPNWRNRFV